MGVIIDRSRILADVDIEAPREAIDQYGMEENAVAEQIATAIEACAEVYDVAVRSINWVPRLSTLRSATEEDMAVQLTVVDSIYVNSIWEKAWARRDDDPEGTITIARTLIEAVCKHILDEGQVEYPENASLPKLYYLTAEQLELAPQKDQSDAIRRVLGNCQAIVGNLAELRNKLGDAHGKGRDAAQATRELAGLAVNLAGSMSAYLVAVWETSIEGQTAGTE